MSDNLTWLLTKNSASTLVRRTNGAEFSRERYNVLNRNSRKYSGYAGNKAIDLSLKDKKIVMTTKVEKKNRFPSKSASKTPLNKGFRAVVHTINSQTSDSFYRDDLRNAALARWTRLNQIAKIEKGDYFSYCGRI